MKLTPRMLLFVALAVAGVALAVPSLTRILNLHVQSTLVVGTNAQAGTTSNLITRTLAPSVQRIDFGVVDAGTALASDDISVPGALLADPCIVNQPLLAADGGPGNAVVRYSCNVTTSGVVRINAVSHSPVGTPQDPPDQFFNLRVISNQ